MMMLTNLLATSTVEMINQMQDLVMDWMTAIITYVNAFVKFIMPLMIYVITFRIVVSKS
jgi:hypothetical protein